MRSGKHKRGHPHVLRNHYYSSIDSSEIEAPDSKPSTRCDPDPSFVPRTSPSQAPQSGVLIEPMTSLEPTETSGESPSGVGRTAHVVLKNSSHLSIISEVARLLDGYDAVS